MAAEGGHTEIVKILVPLTENPNYWRKPALRINFDLARNRLGSDSIIVDSLWKCFLQAKWEKNDLNTTW